MTALPADAAARPVCSQLGSVSIQVFASFEKVASGYLMGPAAFLSLFQQCRHLHAGAARRQPASFCIIFVIAAAAVSPRRIC